jgi:hypothetical protein
MIALTRSVTATPAPGHGSSSLEDELPRITRILVLCWPPVWPLSTVRPRDSVCSRPAALGPGRRGADPAQRSRAASDSEPQAVEVQAFRRAGWLRAEPNVLRLQVRPPSSGASVSVVTHASEQAQTEAAGGSRARVASDRDRRLELSDLGFLA